MMRYLLLTFLVTYVSASDKLPELQGLEVVAEDEQMAQAGMMQMVAEHLGDEEMKNIFDYLGPGLEEFFKGLNSVSDEDLGLDNSTKTGFNKEIDEHFWKIYEDVCNQGKECTDSPFMGCNCHGHFDKLEEATCNEFPCQLVKHGLENSAKFLSDISDQKSLEGLVKVGTEFAEPLMKSACQCNPSLFTTAVSCIKDYNGGLIEGKEDKKGFRRFVKKVKFDALQKVASTMFKAYCGNDEGGCLGDMQKVFMELAAMMDRSCEGEQEDQCNNFRRLSDGIFEFIAFLSEDREEDLTIQMVVKEFYKHIPRNFWCGNEKCAADYLSEHFNNNCCFRNAAFEFDVGTVHNLEKFIRSMFRAVGEKIPKFGKGVRRRVSKMVNPNLACKNRYWRDAKECDALKWW